MLYGSYLDKECFFTIRQWSNGVSKWNYFLKFGFYVSSYPATAKKIEYGKYDYLKSTKMFCIVLHIPETHFVNYL